MGLNAVVVGIVFVLIGVLLLTSLAPTIHTQTNTASTGALENVSATSKTIYNLYDLIWAVAGLVFIVGGAFGLYKEMKSD